MTIYHIMFISQVIIQYCFCITYTITWLSLLCWNEILLVYFYMSIIWIISRGKQRTKHTNILSRVCFAEQHMLMMLQIMSKRWLQTQMGRDLLLINKKGKWRNQWTLIHPWAYVTKPLLGDDDSFFSIYVWLYIGKTPHYPWNKRWKWSKIDVPIGKVKNISMKDTP